MSRKRSRISPSIRSLLASLAGLLAEAGCTGQLPGSFRFAQLEETFSSSQELNTRVDILWVVDNSASMDVSAWRKATVNVRPSLKLRTKRPVAMPTGIAAHARNCSTVARVTQAISGAPTSVMGRPACRVADWISKAPVMR